MTGHQDANPSHTNPSHENAPSFAMLCCAYAAEKAVKSEIASFGWRLAFSRPGFVTAKHDAASELPSGMFVRTASHSIGQTRSDDARTQIATVLQLLGQSDAATRPLDHLHVWPRDRAAIGRVGFEPGLDEVSQAVASELHAALFSKQVSGDAPNRIAQPGQRVLDVVLVDPSHWFIGWHQATTWPTRWPGGVQPIELAEPPVSRAYYKAAEAIAWSGFEMQPGELAVEVGSAPGGACGRLLEQGLRVVGIDPAEMDPSISEHPKFEHIRARAGDLPRRTFRGAKWLLVDSNVKPEKTLTTVSNIVNHRESQFKGLLITMKLSDYARSADIAIWKDQVESWGVHEINIRQLARNRCEVCFAVRMK